MTEGGNGVTEWEALGSRLREVREYLNLSQQHVASATGIARTAISDIERGQRKVDSLELQKFSRLYKYPVAHFLGDEERPEVGEVSALARAVVDLTDGDRDEVLKFAQFLKYKSQQRPV